MYWGHEFPAAFIYLKPFLTPRNISNVRSKVMAEMTEKYLSTCDYNKVTMTIQQPHINSMIMPFS